jgi:hypothetical protein
MSKSATIQDQARRGAHEGRSVASDRDPLVAQPVTTTS